MHKILVSAGVLVVAGLIGYTTTKTVMNNNQSQVATPLGSYGDGWLIVPDVGYDPKTGEKYIGVSGSINLDKLTKKQCFAEEQKVKGLYTQIKQINDQEVRAKTQAIKTGLVAHRARLNKSLVKAQDELYKCYAKNKINTTTKPTNTILPKTPTVDTQKLPSPTYDLMPSTR